MFPVPKKTQKHQDRSLLCLQTPGGSVYKKLRSFSKRAECAKKSHTENLTAEEPNAICKSDSFTAQFCLRAAVRTIAKQLPARDFYNE